MEAVQPPSGPLAQTLSKSLVDVLVPSLLELDMRVFQLRRSQSELVQDIERLTAEPAVARLSLARKRLFVVNGTLKLVQTRLERIQALAMGLSPSDTPA
ncbi:uncharacterized protein BJ171DRAFT_587698 [Polychytrium aggregatum]|uniref:uncharacterized protein n=1 Tax=Polychytrium aggregatum TaxID=110093 RepID=UPI0022FE8C2D|nr:uncharacterized protein BJ171DRAFT_587698 [Polychytrium aggregatum]KAI9193298.1 hypothetical protein BJ171DRAFT_587698 [Polychytrium aggregatum]